MAGETRRLRVVIVGDSKSLEKTFSQLEGGSRRSAFSLASFGAAGAKAFALIGAAVVAAKVVDKIYEVGSSFEKNVNKIVALAKPGETSVKGLNAELQRMGPVAAKMGLNSADASSGMLELVKSGLSVKNALKALPGTMALATAGEMELGEAASLVSNQLNAFKLPASQAADVANIMANAANISSADVSDLAMSLSQVSSSASQAHLSFAETNAALAAFANVGVKGSDAGTSIKTMLMRLSAPTGAAAKTLDKLGVAVFDSHGKMRGFSAILTDLQAKTKNLTDEQRAAAYTTIFGSDAIRAANALIGTGTKGWTQYVAGVQTAGGAQKLAAANTAGLSGAFAALKAKAANAAVALYTRFAPSLEKVVRWFLNASGQTSKFAKQVKALISTYVVPVFEKLVAFLNAYVLPGLSSIWRTTLPYIQQFIAFLRGTLLPFFAQLLAQARPVLTQLGMTFRSVFQAIRVAIVVAVTIIKALWAQFGETILSTIQSCWQSVVAIVQGALQVIQGIADLFVGIFTGNWSKAWEGIKAIFSGATKALLNFLKLWLLGKLLSLVRFGASKILGVFRAGWSKLLGVVRGFAARIKGTVTGFLNGIRRFLDAWWHGIKVYWSQGWSFLLRGVADIGRKIGSKLAGLINGVKNTFKGAGKWLYNAGKNIIQGLINGIKRMVGKLKGWLDKVTGWIPDWKGPASVDRVLLRPAGESIMDGLIGGLDNRTKALKRQLTGITAELGSFGVVAPEVSGGRAVFAHPVRRDAPPIPLRNGGLHVTVHVTVAGSVTAERDLADVITKQIRDNIVRIGKRNGGRAL